MDNSLIKNGTNLLLIDKGEFEDIKTYKLFTEIHSLLHVQKHNAFIELNKWRKLGDKMLRYIEAVNNLEIMREKHIDRLEDGYGEKNNKRWTPEEDELLIEKVCEGYTSLELATTFGRTANAISTRISHLVGIKRLTQNVDGYFRGDVNGVFTEGNISGCVSKM